MEHPGKNILTEDDTYRALMRPTIDELQAHGYKLGYVLYALIAWNSEVREWVKQYHWTEIELKEYTYKVANFFDDDKKERLRKHIEELKVAQNDRG